MLRPRRAFAAAKRGNADKEPESRKRTRTGNLLLVVIALTFLSMALLAASTNCYDRLCTPLLSYLRVLSACQRRIGKKIRFGFSRRRGGETQNSKSARGGNFLLVVHVIALTFLTMALLAASTNCYDRLHAFNCIILSACQRRIGKKIRLSLGFSTVERSPRAAPAWRAPRAVSCTRCGRRAPAQGRWRAALGGQRVQG